MARVCLRECCNIAPQRLARFAKALVLAMAVLNSGACMAWGTDRGAGGMVPANSTWQELRVTRTDSTKIVLRDAVVSRDTVFGTVRGKEKARIAIPLADITEVERRKLTRSSIAVVAGLVASLILFGQFVEGEWDG